MTEYQFWNITNEEHGTHPDVVAFNLLTKEEQLRVIKEVIKINGWKETDIIKIHVDSYFDFDPYYLYENEMITIFNNRLSEDKETIFHHDYDVCGER